MPPAISTPAVNPSHLHESPSEAAFGVANVVSVVKMLLPSEDDAGMTQPYGVVFDDGRNAVAKFDHASATFEALAYRLGLLIGLDMPLTVVRRIPGRPQACSVQIVVQGQPAAYLSETMERRAHGHPEYHAMAIFDWLVGNTDRHQYNYLYDAEADRIRVIDNGQMATFFERRPVYQMRDGLVFAADELGNVDFNLREAPPSSRIPADFRNAILGAQIDAHAQVMQLYLKHANFAKAIVARRKRRVDPNFYIAFGDDCNAIGDHIVKHYGERLTTLQHLFGLSRIQTVSDLHAALYRS